MGQRGAAAADHLGDFMPQGESKDFKVRLRERLAELNQPRRGKGRS
jgi:hypothetical protein